jgi:EpsI family protein
MIGAACLGAAGTAFALVPRRHVSLLARGDLVERIVPRKVADWTSRDESDLIAPKIEGSLVTKLYGETVGRVYSRAGGGGEIMMLMAHGDTQNDDLQLHRPEICYPAFGFAISQSGIMQLGVSSGVSVPSRMLVADAPDRRETIIYWSRLGEYLPLNRKEQQFDRVRTAMKGEIADGLLARFSVVGPDQAASMATMLEFIPLLVRATPAGLRDVLIGTLRASELRARGV